MILYNCLKEEKLKIAARQLELCVPPVLRLCESNKNILFPVHIVATLSRSEMKIVSFSLLLSL